MILKSTHKLDTDVEKNGFHTFAVVVVVIMKAPSGIKAFVTSTTQVKV